MSDDINKQFIHAIEMLFIYGLFYASFFAYEFIINNVNLPLRFRKFIALSFIGALIPLSLKNRFFTLGNSE